MNQVYSELVQTEENTCEGRFNSSLAQLVVVQLSDSISQLPFAVFETNVVPSIVDPFKTSIISTPPSN